MWVWECEKIYVQQNNWYWQNVSCGNQSPLQHHNLYVNLTQHKYCVLQKHSPNQSRACRGWGCCPWGPRPWAAARRPRCKASSMCPSKASRLHPSNRQELGPVVNRGKRIKSKPIGSTDCEEPHKTLHRCINKCRGTDTYTTPTTEKSKIRPWSRHHIKYKSYNEKKTPPTFVTVVLVLHFT